MNYLDIMTVLVIVTVSNFVLLVGLSIAHVLMYRRFARAEFFNRKENTQLRDMNNGLAEVNTVLTESQLAANPDKPLPTIKIRGKCDGVQ